MTTLPELRDLLAAYNPRFAKADRPDWREVARWQFDGADLEKDIIPVIRSWIARKADIYSLRFFERYVLKARDARLEAEKPAATADERVKAERIAFFIRRVGVVDLEKERWLLRYEKEYGAVKQQPSSKETV